MEPGGPEPFSVSTTSDGHDATPGDGLCATVANECSLRAAIEEALALGTDVPVHVPGGTFRLDEGQIPVTGRVRLFGGIGPSLDESTGVTSVAAGPTSRHFQVGPTGDLNLESVALLGGQSPVCAEEECSSFEGLGGSVINEGRLTIGRGVTFQGNDAGVAGGAIYNLGEMSVPDGGVQIVENSCFHQGGCGIFNGNGARLEIEGGADGVLIADNEGPKGGPGGGLWNSGEAWLANITMRNHFTTHIYNPGPGLLMIRDSTFYGVETGETGFISGDGTYVDEGGNQFPEG